MNNISIYRRVGAWAVLLVFLAGWSVGNLHRLVMHHKHNGEHECSAIFDPKVTHIHDERYANDHCTLCAFVLSTPEFLPVALVFSTLAAAPDVRDNFQCAASVSRIIQNTNCLRGPPAAFSPVIFS